MNDCKCWLQNAGDSAIVGFTCSCAAKASSRITNGSTACIAPRNLQVRKRLKRRVALGRGEPTPTVSTRNERWSLDFVHDSLLNARRFRALNVVDDFTREALAIEVDTSISGSRVTRVLDRIADERGYPKTIVMDNGTELTSLAMLAWAALRHVQLLLAPG